MQQRALFKNKDYDISDFDKDMKLKFGFNNIIFVVCLLSPLVIAAFASMLAKRGAVNYLEMLFGNINLMTMCIATTVPAALFLICNALLSDKSNSLIRYVSSNGYRVLKLGAILNMSAWSVVFAINNTSASVFQVIFLALGVSLVVYSFRSKRLYDYFVSSPAIKV